MLWKLYYVYDINKKCVRWFEEYNFCKNDGTEYINCVEIYGQKVDDKCVKWFKQVPFPRMTVYNSLYCCLLYTSRCV